MSLIERQAAIDALDGIIVVGGRNNAVRMMRYIEAVRDRLKQLPSAQPDLCDGCDRYGASCVGEGCGKLEMPEVAKDINVPNNDCISRQMAIDALDVLCQEHRYRIPGKRETYSEYNEAWQDALDRAEGAIGNLPSAQPDGEYISRQAVTESDLIDWYINSVDESEPVWTEEHIHELFNDFYLIPKED